MVQFTWLSNWLHWLFYFIYESSKIESTLMVKDENDDGQHKEQDIDGIFVMIIITNRCLIINIEIILIWEKISKYH